MKILLINTFFHICGGAEAYFFNLADLLKKNGHEVIFFSMDHPKNYPTEFRRYFVSNFPHFDKIGLIDKLRLFFRIFFPFEAINKINQLFRDEKPDIVHIHQISHEITHSIIWKIKKHNIPIVATLHGYSYICPNSELFNGNKVCDICENGKFYNMLFKKCVFDSRIKTLIMMIYVYVYFKIFKVYKFVDLFISPSEFLLKKYKENRLFKKISILHLPYFIDSEKYPCDFNSAEESIVYFGRLEKIKGVDILIRSVKDLDIKLKIIGTGTLEQNLRRIVKSERIKNVEFLGFMDYSQIHKEIKKSLFSVVPSIYWDNYPNVIMESFVLGKPVVASNLGGIPELVRDGITGYLFQAGNTQDLREKIIKLLNNREAIISMGKTAREWVFRSLDPERHYTLLIKEYEHLIKLKNK